MNDEIQGKILLVDDDRILGESFRDILLAKGYQVTYEEEADCAVDLIEEEEFDVVISDLEMPLVDGMELLDRSRKFKPRLPVILITAFSSTERAIDSTRKGAFEYLIKPVDIPELLEVVEKAVASGRLTARPVSLEQETEASTGDTIIGSSKAMLAVFKEIGRVASKPVSVLIEGETGAGKELVARAIFQKSDRSEKPFVAVNCAGVSGSMIESELFGHERGAFANAVSQRIGRFEQADGGTLFLDEIGDLPLEIQKKLLRVLQEQVITRVGGKKEIPIDVRIISASRLDLSELVAAGGFREDLFYRINAVTIRIPPLRDRREDIPALVEYFLQKGAVDFGQVPPSIHKSALRLLEGEVWPGNVRQLENAVRKLLLHSNGRTIGAGLVKSSLDESTGLPQAVPAKSPGGFAEHIYSRLLAASKKQLEGKGAYEVILEDIERELYQQAVSLSHGNQSKIARWLGVSRLTVRDKLDRFDLFPKRPVKKKSTPAAKEDKK